jgi:hypothetical protein
MKIPRKLKKRLNKILWLYDNGIVAFPTLYEKDFIAYKNGELHDILTTTKEEKQEMKSLNDFISVSDEELKIYVDDIFAEQYRAESYRKLLKAKNTKYYFNFVNAYNLYKNGQDSYANICCMAVDEL